MVSSLVSTSTLLVFSVLFVHFFSFAPSFCNGQINCANLTSPTGQTYDLSSFLPLSPIAITVPKYTYNVGVCGAIAGSCNNMQNQAACQIWGSSQGSMAALGSLASLVVGYVTAPGLGVSLIYSGGTANRKSIVTFLCDANVGTLTPTEFVWNLTETGTQGNLVYGFTLNHRVGCPLGYGGGGGSSSKKSGLSGGTIFIIILICVTAVYFVGGIVFLKFVKKEEGKNIIPNVGFWSALPGLVKDGAVFSFRKITCKQSNYTTVSA